jgi:hypothetical protein
MNFAMTRRLVRSALWAAALSACGGGASTSATGGGARAIQEADIYKLAGNTLYILNTTLRGLQIVDVTNPASPTLEGEVLVTGSPREIYIEGNTAYVLVSGSFDYDCGGFQGICGWEARSGVSTLVLAVDVTNPATPKVLGQMRIDGDLQDSRIVGNILYVISDTDSLTYVAPIPRRSRRSPSSTTPSPNGTWGSSPT